LAAQMQLKLVMLIYNETHGRVTALKLHFDQAALAITTLPSYVGAAIIYKST